MEKEGKEMDLNEVMKKLEGIESRLAALETSPRKAEGNGKVLSIKEFILGKKPEDGVQTTLVIGYFLEHFRGENSFNIRDLNESFRSAREPVPANINDKVNLNISKGHMMPAKEKKDNLKAWVLTNTGERFVEQEMLGEG